MTYLVTGGTGFIGSALVRELLAQGHPTVVLTRQGSNTARLPQAAALQIRTYPERQFDRLSDVLADVAEPLQGVFHLAANQRYLRGWDESIQDNVVFTRKLREWSAQRKAGFFAFTSSIDAMGPSARDGTPATETDSPRPLSIYGRAKLEAEQALRHAGPAAGVRTVIFRLGNVYGPESRFLIPDIARAIHEGGAHPLVRYYRQIRDVLVCPCYRDDIVQGIRLAESAQAADGEIFILAGSQLCSLGAIFEQTAQALGRAFTPPRGSALRGVAVKLRNAYYFHVKRRADSVTYFQFGNWAFSALKAQKLLGFAPQVPLAEGIAKTVQWGRETGLIA